MTMLHDGIIEILKRNMRGRSNWNSLSNAPLRSVAEHRYHIAWGAFPETFDMMLDVGSYSRSMGSDPHGKRQSRLERMMELWRVRAFQEDGERRRLSINKLSSEYDKNRVPDVNGDGLAIPFPDRSFSLVTSIDVIEHLSADQRVKALHELVRVASGRAIAVFPFYSEANDRYEREMIGRAIDEGIVPSLATLEHQLYGLPRLQKLEEGIKGSVKKSFHSSRAIYEAYHETQLEYVLEMKKDQKEDHAISFVMMHVARLTSILLNEYDWMATEKNARRVRYVISIDGSKPKKECKRTKGVSRSLREYVSIVPENTAHRDVIVDVFSKIYTKSMEKLKLPPKN